MSDPQARYRLPVGVLHAEVDDEEVLLNPDTGMYHLVNRSGRFLLERLEAGHTLGEAIEALSDSAGQDPQRVNGDALFFVEAMTSRGLLEQVND